MPTADVGYRAGLFPARPNSFRQPAGQLIGATDMLSIGIYLGGVMPRPGTACREL